MNESINDLNLSAGDVNIDLNDTNLKLDSIVSELNNTSSLLSDINSSFGLGDLKSVLPDSTKSFIGYTDENGVYQPGTIETLKDLTADISDMFHGEYSVDSASCAPQVFSESWTVSVLGSTHTMSFQFDFCEYTLYFSPILKMILTSIFYFYLIYFYIYIIKFFLSF